jgi:hypothetical protein
MKKDSIKMQVFKICQSDNNFWAKKNPVQNQEVKTQDGAYWVLWWEAALKAFQWLPREVLNHIQTVPKLYLNTKRKNQDFLNSIHKNSQECKFLSCRITLWLLSFRKHSKRIVQNHIQLDTDSTVSSNT